MMELLNEYKYVSTVSEKARSKGFVRKIKCKLLTTQLLSV